MKLAIRLLFILPFIIASYYFAATQLANSSCYGFIELIIFLFQVFCCFITFLVAVIASIRKRQSEKLKVEPIFGTIILLTLSVIVLSYFFPNLIKGSIAFSAKTGYIKSMHSERKLVFRENGKVEVYNIETDFTCFETYSYQQAADTFKIDMPMQLDGSANFANKFLLREHKLFPLTENNLIDTSKASFVIDLE